MSNEDPTKESPVGAAGEQNASDQTAAVEDPYPDLPGTPDMEYRHRVGLRNLRANKAPNFSSENQPETNGRKPGPNRATILKELLELTFTKNGEKVPNPLTGDGHMTIQEAIDVKLVTKALNGDLKAMQEIKDTVHGKIPEKRALTNGEGEDVDVPAQVVFIDDIPRKPK